MLAAPDRADLVEQIAAALEVAVEAHQEACRLLGVARVFARRMGVPQQEASEPPADQDETENAEVEGMSELKEMQELVAADASVPAVEPADVADPLADHKPLPDGIARISASRLRAIAGWSPGEFRTLASMSDEEFEKARQVGFAQYLRGPSESSSEVHPPPASELLEAAE